MIHEFADPSRISATAHLAQKCEMSLVWVIFELEGAKTRRIPRVTEGDADEEEENHPTVAQEFVSWRRVPSITLLCIPAACCPHPSNRPVYPTSIQPFPELPKARDKQDD
jgi:hypothetical protein